METLWPGAQTQRRCPICSTPGAVCGDNHMQAPPVDYEPTRTEGKSTVGEAPKLREYKWMNGTIEMTGLLTEQQAERMGAEAVGEVEGVEPRRPQQMGLEAEGAVSKRERRPVTATSAAADEVPSKVRKAQDK